MEDNVSFKLNFEYLDGSLDFASMYYKLSQEEWQQYTFTKADYPGDSGVYNHLGQELTLNNGDVIKFKGKCLENLGCYAYPIFRINGMISAYGDLTSIYNEEGGDYEILCKIYIHSSVFGNCIGLTTAPELPFTGTYLIHSGMFNGCINLKETPILPTKIISNGGYYNMFYGCTSLNKVTCLATDISANNCTYNWLAGVSNTGTFIKSPDMNDWPTGPSGIPSGWTVQDYMEI